MEDRGALRSHEREPGTGTPVSDMVQLTHSAQTHPRDQIPKRIQATYAAPQRKKPWWKRFQRS